MGTENNLSDIAAGIEGQKPTAQPTIDGPAPPPTGGNRPPASEKSTDTAEKPRGGKRGNRALDRARLMREYAHLRDRDGLSFDPQLHQHDTKTGEPELTASGQLKRKPGRKPKKGAGGSYIAPDAAPAGDGSEGIGGPEPVTAADQARSQAKIAAGLWFSFCQGLFGPEWKPSDQEREREQVEAGFQEWLLQRGRIQLPPWLILATPLAAYAFPRFNGKETQRRLKKAGAMLRGLFGKLRRDRTETSAADDLDQEE